MEIKKLLEKKKLLIVGVIILGSIGISAGVLAATQLTNSQVKITEQQAKDIVNNEVPNGQITKFKLDREHGKMVYEIEVMEGNIEKEFDIDAETGAIVKLEQEQKNHGNNNSVNNPKISYDKAKEIALKNSKNGKFKEIELKHKNGVL
ncbi:MAG: PepSY domain-containing protein, partial [Fusobacterium periodonticum]|nr:PepSY domain-containing protein [Fusobacterium periodonticum]